MSDATLLFTVLRSRGFTRNFAAVGFILIGLLISAPLQAQPAPQGDMAALQKQLAVLQKQMEQMAGTQTGSRDSFDDSRVRNVGSQIIKRAEPIKEDIALSIRLYDLSDLFAVSPSYPAIMPTELAQNSIGFRAQRGRMIGGGGGFGGGGGGGVFSVPPAGFSSPAVAPQEGAALNMRSAQVSMDQLVNTIKDTVEPEMWGTSRDSAKVQFLGNTLLITATDSMHSQINNLLNLFREHWGKRRTISIQAFLVRAEPTAAADLLDSKTNVEIGAGVVSPEKWTPFITSAKSEKRVAYSATMTGHNNQTLHTLSGQMKYLTVDAEPFETTSARMWFEGPDDAEPFGDDGDDDTDMDYFNRTRSIVGFRPVKQGFHEGAIIEVTPLATRGGNFVILDLHAKVNEFVPADDTEKRDSVFVQVGDQRAEVEMDSTNFSTCRLSTTLRCPKEQIVLAGGMTYQSGNAEDQPNMYLFVKTSVHTIAEDESDWTRNSKNSESDAASKNSKSSVKEKATSKK